MNDCRVPQATQSSLGREQRDNAPEADESPDSARELPVTAAQIETAMVRALACNQPLALRQLGAAVSAQLNVQFDDASPNCKLHEFVRTRPRLFVVDNPRDWPERWRVRARAVSEPTPTNDDELTRAITTVLAAHPAGLTGQTLGAMRHGARSIATMVRELDTTLMAWLRRKPDAFQLWRRDHVHTVVTLAPTKILSSSAAPQRVAPVQTASPPVAPDLDALFAPRSPVVVDPPAEQVGDRVVDGRVVEPARAFIGSTAARVLLVAAVAVQTAESPLLALVHASPLLTPTAIGREACKFGRVHAQSVLTETQGFVLLLAFDDAAAARRAFAAFSGATLTLRASATEAFSLTLRAVYATPNASQSFIFRPARNAVVASLSRA